MDVPDWVERLPLANAGLNLMATLLLVGGREMIRRGQVQAHKKAMIWAFVVSMLFLVFYVIYHAALQYYTGSGSKRFPEEHPGRPFYLTILLTHVVLAAAVPVLAILTIVRGLRQQWDKHRRIARITYPIWVYVSVTGVMIYVMLYHWAA